MVRRLSLTAVLVAVLLTATAQGAGARTITPLPAQWQKGVTVSAYWWQDLSGKPFLQWLGRARTSVRAREVTFVMTGYQYWGNLQRSDQLNATEIHTSFGSKKLCKGKSGRDFRFCKTPDLKALAAAVRRAHALGLRVVVRPQVDVGRIASQSTDRDRINLPDDQAPKWFDSYKAMLSRYARVARDTGAEGLVIGAGLSGMTDTESDREQWRGIVEQLRSGALMGDDKGYKGELTYAAQWDSVVEDANTPLTKPFFWDLLDAISIDAYFPVADGSAGGNPTVDALKAGWTTTAFGGLPKPPVELVRALQAKYAKPVRFTLGYLSQTGAATFPEKSAFDNAKSGGRPSRSPQARAVQAAFDVWSDVASAGWFNGISWWEWPASGRGGANDASFSLQGKSAEVEVCLRHAGFVTKSCKPSKGAKK
ncbi:hypothetical protein DSM112329_03907 [Paraconexibacter sp. AEG42_29]|uniref:Glycoside hydrolase family 5 domain-containing protein n=1 Tax=Paraconexibacter sp. AEG42_29 TaxID=2997339 RepID=A0AAU7AZE4_9ACTN